MNKTELNRRVWHKMQGERQEAKTAVLFTFWLITEAMARGEKVTLPRLGVLDTTQYGERLGRNPESGELQMNPPVKVARFRVSRVLKRSMNP